MTNKKDFVFLPLGGVGEIGMNLALYGFGPIKKRKWIIVDFGVTFPGPELPGVDLVFADISFIEQNKRDIEAIVITHAHEDHYGALLALWDRVEVPVYCTPFTAGMISAKRQSERRAVPEIPLKIFKGGERFKIGEFSLEAIHVTHSIPEPVSLVIETPLGKIIHTGDWKLDPEPTLGNLTDSERLKTLGDEGILALICDSTNAMREGISPSEEDISQGIAEVIAQSKGRVAIASFSSNVGRIKSIAQAAEKTGREVVLLGRSLQRVTEVADELGYLEGLKPFINEDDLASLPRDKVVMILTGTQGESRAALAKLSRNDHPRAHLSAGDTVIFSSRTIPGNEKAVLNIKNSLIDMGVDVISDDDSPVHVSGHPRRNELKTMYEWVKPEIAVPVHGEAAHLNAHARLAADMNVPSVLPVRNGDLLRMAPGVPEVIDQFQCGQIYKDGHIIGDEDFIGVSERRALSFAGHICVSVAIEKTGDIASELEIETQGLPLETNTGEDFEDVVYDAALGALNSIAKKRRRDAELVREAIRRAVRAAARNEWGKKPVTTVIIHIVS